MPDLYHFLEGEIDYAEVERDPTEKTVTKLMKVVSITRTPGGRIARIGFTLKKPKPRDIELEIDEPTARAIAKVFDDAPAEDKPAKASKKVES